VGNKHIIVDWINNYASVKQISVQQSADSLGTYKTILSVADPNAKQNGFADKKAPNERMIYRLFIVLDKGEFLFTRSKRPVFDTSRLTDVAVTGPVKDLATGKPKDSSNRTEPPVVKKPEYVPSVYVYTNREGYVFVNLPDAEQKKYHLKFYDEDGSLLFELKNIKERALTLDKTNFFHAGWFNFELYNEDKMVEKNKVYLSRLF
jgi:hypothetical protein